MLSAADASVRERALQIVYAVDDDRRRVGGVLAGFTADDPDPRVRETAAEFESHMPGVIYDDAPPA